MNGGLDRGFNWGHLRLDSREQREGALQVHIRVGAMVQAALGDGYGLF